MPWRARRGVATKIECSPEEPSKLKLLFISPVVPDDSGNGLSMRAAIFMQALAADHNVDLLVVPVLGPSPDVSRLPSAAKRCRRLTIYSAMGKEDPRYRMAAGIKDPRYRYAALVGYPKPLLVRFASETAVAEIAALYEGQSFACVHVFRLYMAPFAEPFLEPAGSRPPLSQLDLDDYESKTRGRFADLYDGRGDDVRAHFERAEAAKYARMEDAFVPRFSRVFVCAEADRVELECRYGSGNLCAIPNGIFIPPTPTTPRTSRTFTLLFVGTMDYVPNEDAMVFFCEEILPQLRQRADRPFRLIIVGRSPSERVVALAAFPEIAVTGAVRDVASYYRRADAVVAPLRAGGGTRIKILEAFAHRRPVVATSVGAEGIDARDGEHLLIADTADAFADACLRLMRHPADAGSLVNRAFALVRSAYDRDRVRETIRRLSSTAR